MSLPSTNNRLSALGLTVWLLAALFFLYEFFLRTFIGSVAHQVIPDLHLTAETFAIVGSAYFVAYGIMQVPVGILADKFGVRVIMFFAIMACAAATVLFSFSSGFYSAIISRFLMGFGSSFAFVCLLVIVVNWLPKQYFGFFIGMSQFIGTMGPLLAAGPLIALMAGAHESWRGALLWIAMFGVLLAVAVVLVVRNKPSNNSENAMIFLRSEDPLRNRLYRLFRNRQAWYIAFYSALVYVSISLLGALWGTEYLQARGLSQVDAASIISIVWLGYALSCPGFGFLSDVIKRRKPILIVCALLGVLSTLGILYLPINQNEWLYGVLFFGLGMAASGQNIGFAMIAENADLGTKATALGLNNGMIAFCNALLPPAVSYFIYLSAKNTHHVHNLQPDNFILPLTIMPVVSAVALLISLFAIRETYCKPQKGAIRLQV